ncbi:MAG TPA: N-acetyl-gamma-glutamyl-phosphate reductase [Myxococcaceae bacterium]|nr:N-acetyl-gamma-glutamyl-phosphate reductase [Myxococcaceae bacterium]
MSHNYEVGVVGASGYSGIELCRLLAQHPDLALRFVASERWEGETVRARTGIGGAVGALRYVAVQRAVGLARSAAAVLLATPADVSLRLAPGLLEAGVRVVDLSGAFRLGSPEAYPAAYGFAHPHPALLAEAVYGLPELGRSGLGGARLVANPGCYPTAAALAVAPLLAAGVLADEAVVVDAASGVTGAGRQAQESFSFAEVDEDVRAYRVLRHQHTPEIAQSFARARGRRVAVTFTAHLLPVRRGILSTASARLAAGASPEQLRAALESAYGTEPLVEVVGSPEEVSLRSVVGTPRARIGLACATDGFDPGRVVIVSALDNLLKGAASQAIQNLNAMLGLGETRGLVFERGGEAP